MQLPGLALPPIRPWGPRDQDASLGCFQKEDIFSFFFLKIFIYLYIWLRQVLVAA